MKANNDIQDPIQGYIQVLWVEDDPKVIDTYRDNADMSYGLQLVPFPCWDDAKEALESDFHRWEAIILDAKCKYHRDSADNAIEFLREALDDISTICEKKKRIIPWYVLTGGDTSEVSDSINDKRMKWDSDWTEKHHKKYYSKNVDVESLFGRIQSHAQKSNRLQIREMYWDTFELLKKLLKCEEVCEDIAKILEAMHFPSSTRDFIPRLYYNPLRKGLEYIFRAANRGGIIPDAFFDKDQVNLNQCFMYLIGKDAEKVGYRYGNHGEKIASSYIENMMSIILNLGNVNSHSQLREEELQDTDNRILREGMNSKHIVFSMALQLCEIASWMNRYITEHPDKEENLKKCVKIEKVNDDELEGVVNVQKIYHIGSKFQVSPVLVFKNGGVGKKVKIVNYGTNRDENLQRLYPFFASNIQLIEE